MGCVFSFGCCGPAQMDMALEATYADGEKVQVMFPSGRAPVVRRGVTGPWSKAMGKTASEVLKSAREDSPETTRYVFPEL